MSLSSFRFTRMSFQPSYDGVSDAVAAIGNTLKPGQVLVAVLSPTDRVVDDPSTVFFLMDENNFSSQLATLKACCDGLRDSHEKRTYLPGSTLYIDAGGKERADRVFLHTVVLEQSQFMNIAYAYDASELAGDEQKLHTLLQRQSVATVS